MDIDITTNLELHNLLESFKKVEDDLTEVAKNSKLSEEIVNKLQVSCVDTESKRLWIFLLPELVKYEYESSKQEIYYMGNDQIQPYEIASALQSVLQYMLAKKLSEDGLDRTVERG